MLKLLAATAAASPVAAACSTQHVRWHGCPHRKGSPQVDGPEYAFAPWRPNRPPVGEPSRASAVSSPRAGSSCARCCLSSDRGWSRGSSSELPRGLSRLSVRIASTAVQALGRRHWRPALRLSSTHQELPVLLHCHSSRHPCRPQLRRPLPGQPPSWPLP